MKIFISYSHKDEEWKNRLEEQLKVFEIEGNIEIWSDSKIQTGDRWFVEIKKAIEQSNIAIILISTSFLISDFICKKEIPAIMQKMSREEHFVVFPIILEPCNWKFIDWLSQLQVQPKDGKPLTSFLTEHDIKKQLSNIAFKIYAMFQINFKQLNDIKQRLNKIDLPSYEILTSIYKNVFLQYENLNQLNLPKFNGDTKLYLFSLLDRLSLVEKVENNEIQFIPMINFIIQITNYIKEEPIRKSIIEWTENVGKKFFLSKEKIEEFLKNNQKPMDLSNKMSHLFMETPPSRFVIQYIKNDNDREESIEIPHRVLVIANFVGFNNRLDDNTPLDKLEKLIINKSNINMVIKKLGIYLSFNVVNEITEEECLKIDLWIEKMEDFHPDNIVKQIPILRKLVQLRKIIYDFHVNFFNKKKRVSGVKTKISKQDLVEKFEVEFNKYFETEIMYMNDYDKKTIKQFIQDIKESIYERDIQKKIIDEIDQRLSKQVNEILHNEFFKELESAWRGLAFVINRTDFRQNIQIDILNCSKWKLMDDFEDTDGIEYSGLYNQLYLQEHDTHGSIPYAVIVANYEFDHSSSDINLLSNISKVAAAVQCPFISSVGPQFFGFQSIEELRFSNVNSILKSEEYALWNKFRLDEDSRYIGLTLNKFLVRLPYSTDVNPIKSFDFVENINDFKSNFLCCNPVFAFLYLVNRSFARYGLCNNILGFKSGGKIEDLPVHIYQHDFAEQTMLPAETPFTSIVEYELTNNGFIPLISYINENFAVFFSARSSFRIKGDDIYNANLPYLFIVSRISHYIKIIHRDMIERHITKQELNEILNAWLKSLVTDSSKATPEQMQKYPFRNAEITIDEDKKNLGTYIARMKIRPNFKIEGSVVDLSLVFRLANYSAW